MTFYDVILSWWGACPGHYNFFCPIRGPVWPLYNTVFFCLVEDLSWACSAFIGQFIYAIIYGVTSAAYVLLTTLGSEFPENATQEKLRPEKQLF